MKKTAFIHRVMQHGISRIAMLSVALLCMVVQGAWAENVKYIYYQVIDFQSNISLQKATGTAENPTALTSTLLEKSSEDNLGTGWYVLNSSFSYGERIVISGDVHLILKDGCTLTAEQGIRINTDAKLSIYAQSETVGTMGKLVAIETHHDKAAIGGNKNYRAGGLVIHGGEIEATCKDGSKYAAGIGGGYGDGSGMKEITIYGGDVTAQGAYLGAGIGGGKNNNYPGTITIYGGTVRATGGEYGAGIGGGENRAGWDTNVYGGNITAQGGYYGAGIGGGEEGAGGNLHFYGGTVNATGGNLGAGIGGGEDEDGGTITIDGGNITATGTEGGPGIGAGGAAYPPRFEKSGTITINGGTVIATGSGRTGTDMEGSAGIGTGSDGSVETITITGGDIKAYGKRGAAGIGGGSCSDGCGVITISGGTIFASGGSSSWQSGSYCGAGIGSGCKASGSGQIYISGTADITAESSNGAAAIGAGTGSEDKMNISITGGHIQVSVGYSNFLQNTPMLIGMGSNDRLKDKNATVTISDGLAVWAGEDRWNTPIMNYSDRVSACTGRNYYFADINTHTEHSDYTYTLGDFPEEHVPHCGYCGKTQPAEKHTNDGTGKCEKCGYATHVHTVKVYQITGSGTGYGEGTSLADVIPGQTVILPDIDQSSLPAYMVFEGWLQASTAPTTWEKQDGETLLPAGSVVTPASNTNFYARYSYQYGTEWTWTASSKTASATLKVINLETGSVVETIASSDGDVLINANVISATLLEPGSVQYNAQVNYTDAKGRQFNFTDTHTVPLYVVVSLDEDDNTTTLSANDGGIVTATLTGRTLYKNSKWNTLCLPFDVADISSSPLAGATIKEFTDVSLADGTLTLTFADATSIKAGHAYLIKWDSDTDLGSSDLVFTGVTLAKDLRDDAISTDDSGTAAVAFMGTYKKLSYTADDKSILFLGENNTLYYPKSGASIGAQRAYFKLSGITAGDLPQQARSIVLDFGDGETTSISEELRVKSEKFATATGWYTLDGLRLSGKPTTKGIYISNGNKVVIK